MKKSVKVKIYATLFVIAFFVLSFFSHYQTISKYDIVSGMSIDVKNGVYTIVCEVYVPSSAEDFGGKAEYVKGRGFTIKDALYNANLKSTNRLYLDSVQLYVVSRSAYEKNEVENYFKTDFVNNRATAVLCEKDASEIICSEEQSQSRAKSLSLSQKIKSFCNEQSLDRPNVIKFLKTGGEVFIDRDGLLQKGGKYEIKNG